MNNMGCVVITGATGMIGVALTKACVARGTGVVAVVRPGSANLDRMPDHPLVRVVECALPDLAELAVPEKEIDCFYHLAWEGAAGEGRRDVALQCKNIGWTMDAVRAAHRLGCAAFFGAGSQAEYGLFDAPAGPETSVNPNTPYGVAKLAAGLLSGMFCKELGIRHIWGRIFSVYGPYDAGGTLLMHLARELIAGRDAEVTGCGQQWDYLYSEDAADALYLLGMKGRGVYCVGSGSARPLKEYVEPLRTHIGGAGRVLYGARAYGEGQPMYVCADIKKLTADTGFEPRTAFERGIERTVEWYKKGKLT